MRSRWRAIALRRACALESFEARRRTSSPAKRSRRCRSSERTQRLAERAQRALATLLHRLDARVENSGKLLSALSYRGVLARGFALVRDEAGHPLHAADAIGPGARVEIEFADGRVGATTDADRPTSTAKRAPAQPKAAAQDAKPAPKRVGKPVDQGTLF